jgi:sugar phosphate isomerase/epimerase
MPFTRRKFIQSSVTSGAALWLGRESATATMKKRISIPPDFSIRVMATNWGFTGSLDEFCANVKKAGYDGIEVVFPHDESGQKALLETVRAHGLLYAFLVGTGESDYSIHLKNFEKTVRGAVATNPFYINCHAGRDHFSMAQNKAFIDLTTQLNRESKVPVYHETHRSRILYSAPVARDFISKIPDLRLTLDISHWCAVHESLLADQAETIDLALRRTDHIHARIGHPEGPQVNDPRAPEWSSAVEAHLAWWDKVVAYKAAAGASFMTFLTEFGPVDYMPAMPYTRQPLANQWEINLYMLDLLRKRYRS